MTALVLGARIFITADTAVWAATIPDPSKEA
jgi:hypothetical protein